LHRQVDPNSLTLTTQTKFTGQTVTVTSVGDWTNQEIEIDNANGEVTVVHLSATPFAFANGEAGLTDADGAMADVRGTIAISETGGKVTVKCGQAATQ
jgi:hypothetical protein